MASAGEDIASDSPPSNLDAPGLVGGSPAFRQALRDARRLAGCRLPVVVTGESGSGKEGIARVLHLGGPRRTGPFLAVNCSAVPEGLLEAELFGSDRGAYTGSDRDRPGLFRLADGGTLFLDEIGEMPLAMQPKLLRVLQDGIVRPVGSSEEHATDVRIVAATHRDLRGLVAARRFRQDLYYRLAVVEIHVPPLRERLDDLPALAEHLLSRLRGETGIPESSLDASALEKLRAHGWPGNVRELETVLARATLRAKAGRITAADVSFPGHPDDRPLAVKVAGALERDWIGTALAESGGNLSRAAARIGWTRQKLYRRMKALGVPRPVPGYEAGSGGSGSTPSSSSTFQ